MKHQWRLAVSATALLVALAVGSSGSVGASTAFGEFRQVSSLSNFSAQVAEGESTNGSSTTSSSTSVDPTTSSTAAPSDSTTTVPAKPTTTSVPVTTIPPELAGDPRAPIFVNPGAGDGGDAPVAQPQFSSASSQVLNDRVDAAQLRLDGARSLLTAIQTRVIEVDQRLKSLRSKFASLGAGRKKKVLAASSARRELRSHAVSAFMNGRPGNKMVLMRSGDPVEMGVAHRYLSTVVSGDDDTVRRYEAARKALDSQSAQLAEQIATAESDALRLQSQMEATVTNLGSAAKELAAYGAGAQLYVDGFAFPVAGPVDFIDSWGFPRMTGTKYSHWHQGTDIFAAQGTPLVATEDGTLAKIGSGVLGGNKLWVVGESGTEYYYAHLSAFAAGAVNGKAVKAGEVVGYVGNTGNALGTPFHLHFEIHPNGEGAVNPYPLLKAVYSSAGRNGLVLGSPEVPIAAGLIPAPTTVPTTTAPPTPTVPRRPGG